MMNETPRSKRIRLAMVKIVSRADQPSPGKIQRELGELVTHNLNGRDSATYADMMETLGFVRVYGPDMSTRWRRP